MKRFFVFKNIGGEPKATENKYLVVNTDEPYAEAVFTLIRDAEKAKGTWDGPEEFKDFCAEI